MALFRNIAVLISCINFVMCIGNNTVCVAASVGDPFIIILNAEQLKLYVG